MELSKLRGVAGPGVDVADVLPALDAPFEAPAGAFLLGGIFAM